MVVVIVLAIAIVVVAVAVLSAQLARLSRQMAGGAGAQQQVLQRHLNLALHAIPSLAQS